jgi:hypothetical protein
VKTKKGMTIDEYVDDRFAEERRVSDLLSSQLTALVMTLAKKDILNHNEAMDVINGRSK